MTNSPNRFRSLTGLVAVLALVAAACGSSGDAGTTSTAAPQATTTTAAPAATTTTTSAPSTDTTGSSAPPATTTTLPGEPTEIFPRAGDRLGVVAVAHNDVLNLRSGPGTDNPVLLQLPGTTNNLIATGQGRKISQTVWYQVTVDGVPGWVSSRFVAFLGIVNDTTSQIVDRFGTIPVAENMTDLGSLVAGLEASEDVTSRIRLTVAPTVGDLGEVTYDVVDVADDSLFGLRLHIFGEVTESGEAFSLKTVEATALCFRGVTSDGLCV